MSLTAKEFKVLNYLDIKKSVAGAESVGEATGLRSDEVEPILRRFEGEGYYLSKELRITPKGEDAANSYRRTELSGAARVRLDGAYSEFEWLDSKLKQVVTDWQIRNIGGSRVVNDHRDREYDFGVLSRLFDLHLQAGKLFRELVQISERYEVYHKRLTVAVEKIKQGNPDYLSKPTIDSYHNVWFEFHEDLLNLMGKKRVE